STDIDGIKHVYNDGSWFLVRISGTENVVRIYCESKQEEITELILNKVIKLIT
ncbi:MAG TPA: phosphoglucomutase/phosphomannomutase family protein, partial [Dehalococcoidia bacterium]|nr:phosphoglucomutase/phosphomannomutase family protein [Dehalococcoidia bacterium]